MKHSTPLSLCAFLMLAACGSQTMTPDYAINVTPTPDGKSFVAVPPSCPSFVTVQASPFDSQPNPQWGCATARNLAFMVEEPQDLLEGRNISPASGVTAAGAILRYNSNQTRGLIELGNSPDTSAAVTTASTGSSALSGETPVSAGSSK